MGARISFSGSSQAEAFTKEIEESFAGVLGRNYISDAAKGPVGFVSASIDGRYWWDTMWSRDQGTFLRELVHYGELDKAKETWQASVDHVALNDDGYYSFPMYVYPNQPKSGKEMDGTAVWIISSVLLWERLPQNDPIKTRIERFLTAETSPVRYVLYVLEHLPFVEGSGEFGGGMSSPADPFFNVVQNGQVAMMLDMIAARFRAETQETRLLRDRCADAAKGLKQRMLERMVFDDGTWIWCLDPQTGRQASDELLYHEANKGFGGINGILSHSSDVYGFLPEKERAWFASVSNQTFWKLLAEPIRLEQFYKYGMYIQFEQEHHGWLTSAAYGQGYAIQCMLMMDLPQLYTKAIHYLINATMEPAYPVTRESKYWFYERYLSPDSIGKYELEEGCGALNLVNVSEPLKCARLMLGIDDSKPDMIRIVPRLPLGWSNAQAERIPVRTSDGHLLMNVIIDVDSLGKVTRVYGESDDELPGLHIRLGTAINPQWIVIESGNRQFDVRSIEEVSGS